LKKIWQIQTLYFYLVSFIALILMITGSVKLARTAIIYLIPLPQDQSTKGVYPESVPRKPDTPYINEPEILKLWEERFGPALMQQEKERYETIARENHRRSLIRELLAALAYLAAAIPVYLYHWRKIPQLEQM
jgi:hypothetical protein